MFISPITEHRSSRLDKDLPVLPVPLGELGMANPCLEANFEQSSSVKVTTPLVRQIVAGSHQIPNDSFVKLLQQTVKSERAKALNSRQGSAYRRGSFTENLVSPWSFHENTIVSLADRTSPSSNSCQPKLKGLLWRNQTAPWLPGRWHLLHLFMRQYFYGRPSHDMQARWVPYPTSQWTERFRSQSPAYDM